MEMPKYLFSKRFLTISVIAIFMFSIPFLMIYKPFSATIWLGISTWRHFGFTVLFYVLVISVMGLSKVAIYQYQSTHTLTLTKFIFWALAEYLVLALIYLFLTPAATGHAIEISPSLVLKASLCVTLIIALPYSFLCLAASNRALREEFDAYKASVAARENKGKVTLYDYRDIPAITLDADDIEFMESQDNYVMIHYLSEGKEHNYMLRCPTQKLEASLEGTSLIRCHRSYIVNIKHISEFVRGHNRAVIKMDNNKEISVSKSYYKSVLTRIKNT